jgi:hypothetical protein
MKRSQLVELIREELQGYSKYIGKTKGGTSDEFMQILTKIAKGEDQGKYQGDAERGNAILDKANPDNVDRITRGEDPIYEEASNKVSIMLDDLTVDKIKEIFPNFGEKYGQLSFPTPSDSLTQINSQESLERWKDSTREQYGNVEVIFLPEETIWYNQVKINNPEFTADKETSTKRKASWLDGEREAGRTGGLD